MATTNGIEHLIGVLWEEAAMDILNAIEEKDEWKKQNAQAALVWLQNKQTMIKTYKENDKTNNYKGDIN